MIKGLIVNNIFANVTFVFGKYELSLANDTSCKKDGVLRRSSMCIFSGNNNVTSKFYPEQDEIFGVKANDVFEAMKTLKQMNKGDENV